MTSDGLSFLAIESALEYVVQLLNDEDTDVRELAEFLFNALTSLHSEPGVLHEKCEGVGLLLKRDNIGYENNLILLKKEDKTPKNNKGHTINAANLIMLLLIIKLDSYRVLVKKRIPLR